MNEAEKERLIKKDIKSIENRVRAAFNQGYDMGLKEVLYRLRDEIEHLHDWTFNREWILMIIDRYIEEGERHGKD